MDIDYKKRFQFMYLSITLITVIVVFIMQRPVGFIFGYSALMLFFIFGFLSEWKINKNLMFIVVLSMFLTIPTLLYMAHGYSTLLYLAGTIISLLAAERMSRYSIVILLQTFQFIFWGYVLFSLIVYYIFRESAEPFGELVAGLSTNGIPSFLIVIQVVLSLVTYVAKGKLPITSPIFTLVISLLGIGRGSIIIALMILFFSLLFNSILLNKSRLKGLVWLILLLTVLILVVLSNWSLVYDYLSVRTKLTQGVYDIYRAQIFSEYISKISGLTLFTGASYEGTVIDALYAGNPHIAYIRTHAYLGIGVLMLIVFSPLVFFLRKSRLSDKIVFLTFVLLIHLRIFSEPVLFPTIFDVFYFLIIFFYINFTSEIKS